MILSVYMYDGWIPVPQFEEEWSDRPSTLLSAMFLPNPAYAVEAVLSAVDKANREVDRIIAERGNYRTSPNN